MLADEYRQLVSTLLHHNYDLFVPLQSSPIGQLIVTFDGCSLQQWLFRPVTTSTQHGPVLRLTITANRRSYLLDDLSIHGIAACWSLDSSVWLVPIENFELKQELHLANKTHWLARPLNRSLPLKSLDQAYMERIIDSARSTNEPATTADPYTDRAFYDNLFSNG